MSFTTDTPWPYRWLWRFLPLRFRQHPPAGRTPPPEDAPLVRFLRLCDVPALCALERQKWTDEQAADATTLAHRIAQHPDLCLGAFCPRTGRALASVFLKPISPAQLDQARSWYDCAQLEHLPAPQAVSRDRLLFGISLSSRSPVAMQALLPVLWAHILQQGWRGVVLGTPIPGWQAWQAANPQGRVEDYVHSTQGGRPLDPQLRYYRQRGFTRVLKIVVNYFPHERSRDYGVMIEARTPMAQLALPWHLCPLPWLSQWMQRLLTR